MGPGSEIGESRKCERNLVAGLFGGREDPGLRRKRQDGARLGYLRGVSRARAAAIGVNRIMGPGLLLLQTRLERSGF